MALKRKTKIVVAVVGSARPDTIGEPADLESARAAAKQIGFQLAREGFGLMVFSSDERFIAPFVVKGYLDCEAAAGRSVVDAASVSHPTRYLETYPELASKGVFVQAPDHHQDWEVGYFTALKERADALLVIGGGDSALAAAIHCIDCNKPVYCVARFGGAAELAWKYLSAIGSPLLEPDEIRKMAGRTLESSQAVGTVLSQQLRRRQRLKNGDKPVDGIVAASWWCIVLTLLFVLSMAFNMMPSARPTSIGLFYLLFFASLLLGGGAGSVTRQLFSNRRASRLRPLSTSLALGFGAGFFVGCSYAIPHILSVSNNWRSESADAMVLALSLMPPLVAYTAGIGSDYVYARLTSAAKIQADQTITQLGPTNDQIQLGKS
jgi:hypothetical protein